MQMIRHHDEANRLAPAGSGFAPNRIHDYPAAGEIREDRVTGVTAGGHVVDVVRPGVPMTPETATAGGAG